MSYISIRVGRILVNGHSTAHMPLKQLRRQIAIVPQVITHILYYNAYTVMTDTCYTSMSYMILFLHFGHYYNLLSNKYRSRFCFAVQSSRTWTPSTRYV